MTVAAPSYCVEIAPPNWRGRMVGIYNCGWFGGSVPAAGEFGLRSQSGKLQATRRADFLLLSFPFPSAVCFGTQYINGQMSWRLPLVLQCVPATIVLVAVGFIRESIRSLVPSFSLDAVLTLLPVFSRSRISSMASCERKGRRSQGLPRSIPRKQGENLIFSFLFPRSTRSDFCSFPLAEP